MGGVASEDPGKPTAQAQQLAVVQAGILARNQPASRFCLSATQIHTPSDPSGGLVCPKMWASFSPSFYKPTPFLSLHSLPIFAARFCFLFLFLLDF